MTGQHVVLVSNRHRLMTLRNRHHDDRKRELPLLVQVSNWDGKDLFTAMAAGNALDALGS
jgi:hypothetical protein